MSIPKIHYGLKIYQWILFSDLDSLLQFIYSKQNIRKCQLFVWVTIIVYIIIIIWKTNKFVYVLKMFWSGRVNCNRQWFQIKNESFDLWVCGLCTCYVISSHAHRMNNNLSASQYAKCQPPSKGFHIAIIIIVINTMNQFINFLSFFFRPLFSVPHAFSSVGENWIWHDSTQIWWPSANFQFHFL